MHFVLKYGTLVERHEEDREDRNGGSGDGKEINRDQVEKVMIEKGPPRL